MVDIRDARIAALEADLAAAKEKNAELSRSATAWEETARAESGNRDYYRGLLVSIGQTFGVEARTQDDGGIVDEVLVAKVPELVARLQEQNAAWALIIKAVRARLTTTKESPQWTWVDFNYMVETVRSLLSDCDHAAIIKAHDAEVRKPLEEQNAALAAALEKLKRNALEMAGYVKSYGLDDAGPQSEWSRWSQCRSNIENESDPPAILASVRDEARREGAVEALTAMMPWSPDGLCTPQPVWLILQEMINEIKRRIAALKGGA